MRGGVRMLGCEKTTELIPLFMENELSDEERGQLEEHLLSCESCRATCESMQDLMDTIHLIEDEELPEDFHNELMSKLNELAPRTIALRKYKPIALTAACIAAVFIAVSVLAVGISSLVGFDDGTSGLPVVGTGDHELGYQLPLEGRFEDISPFEAEGGIVPIEPATDILDDQPGDNGITIAPELPIVSVDDIISTLVAEQMASSITNFTIELVVDDLNQAIDQISMLDGIQTSIELRLPVHDRDRGYANISRRASPTEFEVVKEQLRTIGTVVTESEFRTNMSRDLNELGARLTAKEMERERLLELLSMSDDLDVLLRIQANLNIVLDENDQLNSRMRSINAEIGQPYIFIVLRNRVHTPPPQPVPPLGVRMSNSFNQSVNGMILFMQGLLLFMVGAIVPISVFIVFTAFIYLFVRFISKRRNGGF